jgi:hypothetical protein
MEIFIDTYGDNIMQLIDLTGERIGVLTVLSRDTTSNHKRSYWICRCECGKVKSMLGDGLRSGKTKSCGCKVHRQLSDNEVLSSKRNRYYRIWRNIKTRCFNPNSKDYNRYGGRGVTICEKWVDDSRNFIDYIQSLRGGNDPQLTLDRIDSDKNYEPGNLRWASPALQARNRQNTISPETVRILEQHIAMGKYTNQQLADMFNISISSLKTIKRGEHWSQL